MALYQGFVALRSLGFYYRQSSKYFLFIDKSLVRACLHLQFVVARLNIYNELHPVLCFTYHQDLHKGADNMRH